MIKSTIYNNADCLKCHKIEKDMVIIGSIVMCQDCFEVEFNIDRIDPKSELGIKYYQWLKKDKARKME